MFADLHLHSFYSDGSESPDSILRRGLQIGLQVVSITDHDTLEGISEAKQSAILLGMHCITGVELTTEFEGYEVHLLGYGIKATEDFERLLNKFQQARRQRIYRMIEKLNRLGIPISCSDVFEIIKGPSPGRPHIAAALVKCGFCTSHEEAFSKYLHTYGPAWVPKPRLRFEEALQWIHLAKGVAVIAHPGLLAKENLIPKLLTFPIDGIECFYSKHNEVQTKRYIELAKERNLLITGGSDCHGKLYGRPTLGEIKLAPIYWKRLFEKIISNGGEIISGKK